MKIAQVAPLYESVPPKQYGGTERVVSYLTEELVKLGHDVTLYASGDSETNARLVPVCERSLRLNDQSIDHLAHHILQLELIARDADRFDIIHFHNDYLNYPLSRRLRTPHVTTLHGRLDIPDLQPLYAEYTEVPLVSISDSQRAPLPDVNWIDTVYHGIPPELYNCNVGTREYLAFVGRISREKRPDRAIRIAKAAGKTLKIAAKVDKIDREYFETEIEPMLDDPSIEFIGEIGDGEKPEFVGRAEALLFPIDWPEPFGLVMIEAMACGTPVIAWRCGSVPEIIDDGITGIVVQSEEAAVAAVARASEIDRARCQKKFLERFSARRMAEDYLEVYERLVRGEFMPFARVA